MKKNFFFLFLQLVSIHVIAQTWNSKKAAVVLTYDDGLNVHIDNAATVLDSFGFKGTFYLPGNASALNNRIPEWKKMASNGHELGNHSLFHPCVGKKPGREFVTEERDLNNYTVARMVDEVRVTNTLLNSIDSKYKRTFAYPCGDMLIKDSAYFNQLKKDFVAARGVQGGFPTIDRIDLANINCYGVNGQTSEQLIAQVKEALKQNSLIVFLFHGVGGEHSLNVSLQAHRELLEFLKQNEKDLWIATMVDVAEYISAQQQKTRMSAAQFTRDSINKLTEADYKKMLALLGVSKLRPGVNGNDPNAPNAANYDEAKANPYPVLPDPLTLKNGTKVKNAKTWWNKRRPEIVEDFDREIYGRTPANLPRVDWQVTSYTNEEINGIPVVTKKLNGRVDNSSYPSIGVNIQLTVTTPSKVKGPVPLIMELAFVFPPGFSPPRDTSRNPPPSWQQQVLEKGWGYAVLIPVSIQADNGAGLTSGIIGLMNKGQTRKVDDWGALKAWAWGASKAMDYFEKDPAIDAKRIGIEGHSRYGKAALVTMAYDPRFAIGFISSSGAAGAKLHRRNAGEIVENVAASGEYHWMAVNYMKYAGPLTWDDLPVDAHELIALVAPRPLFISSGNRGDAWVDVRGMFMATVAAGPVYELLNKKGLGTNEFPKVETGLLKGDLVFRQHNGGHTPGPNWPYFLAFAEKYFKKK